MIWKKNQFFSIINTIFWQTAGIFIAGFYIFYRFIFPYKGGSHPVSKFFKNVFEKEKAKTTIVILMLFSIFALNFTLIPLSYGTKNQQQPVKINENQIEKIVFNTETTYQQPTYGWLSQGFHWYHRAIDIATQMDQEVYPIAAGVVTEVQYTQWGYGHYIIIEHNNQYKSLYAHFGDIEVQPGQEINKNTLLGYIGMTGRTTGPHLHLEIYQEDQNINPTTILEVNE